MQNLTQWFGQDLNVVAKWLLTRDHAGYELPLHSDAWVKLVAGLFYLPRPELENAEGTTLLEVKSGRDPAFDDKLRGHMNDFTVVNKLPYAANTMLAFARCENSYHCVQKLGPEVVQRDNLLFNVMGAQGRFASS